MKIEKIIHQIWVGDEKKPKKWMDTWKEKNPDWEYVLWTNSKVFKRNWINQKLIEYYKRNKKYNGVADIIRYEILYEYGGVVIPADSECLENITELFDNDYELFAVRCRADAIDWACTNEEKKIETPKFLKSIDKFKIVPIYGAKSGNEFVKHLIDDLYHKYERELPNYPYPPSQTGNKFCTEELIKYAPEIKIFPMHYFIPYHPIDETEENSYYYRGKDKIYARHYWGTTFNNYNKGR
ncbi:MAG TPA: glycosyltransferase [bacterium]|nr:glycosyltransferase [bacterium]